MMISEALSLKNAFVNVFTETHQNKISAIFAIKIYA